MHKGLWIGIVAAAALIVVLMIVAAVSRQQSAPPTGIPQPTPSTGSPPTLPVTPASPSPSVSLVVAITASGFVPSTLTVRLGETVTFWNEDTENHQVSSNPHPVHTDYPQLNGGVLTPSESRSVAFSRAGTFGYHDHLNPALQGTIVVQGQ